MSLQVLAAGLPRTGTTSLKAALQVIGYGPSLHMEDLFRDSRRCALWARLFEEGTTDLDQLFEGYRSTTDFPGCLLVGDLFDSYPDLKVVLNYRDPAAWYDSIMRTIYPAANRTAEEQRAMSRKAVEDHRFVGINAALSLVDDYLLKGYFRGQLPERGFAIAAYEDHYATVRQLVPAGQLLEYRVEEGWAPLCKFLSVDLPEAEFPHKNTSGDFQQQVMKMIAGGGQARIS